MEDGLPGGRAAGVDDVEALRVRACRACRSASRWRAAIVCSRSSSEISIRSAEWRRGITSAWPRVAGLMSMKATVCSSESTISAGASPATIAQKMQSASACSAWPEPIGNRSIVVEWRPTRATNCERDASRSASLGRPHLAGEHRRLDLAASSSPSSGPGSIPSAAASSSPAIGARGGPSRCQASAAGQHLAGELEVRLDHLRRRGRPGAPRGEAVGDGEQGDVGGDRRGELAGSRRGAARSAAARGS